MTGELSSWKDFDLHAHVPGPGFFGFASELGDVNRFAARYRAASCFKSIELEGFSEAVSAGYAALCRVLFVYSAFEAYLKIKSLKQKSLSDAFSKFGASDLLKKVRAADTEDRFYKFIYERVDESHKKELDLYFKDDPCNVAYLASAIRHIFAHGWLSPSAGGAEAAQAVQVCDMVSEFMLSFLDKSFSDSINAGLRVMSELK